MRSKLSWWTAVALLSVLYGLVGLAATFDEALESIFGRQKFSMLETSGGWISFAAVIAIALTSAVLAAAVVARHRRLMKICGDLVRLHAAAMLGALITCAVGSARPSVATPLALALTVSALSIDRWIEGERHAWQSWALASQIALIALPILILSRL